MIKLKSSNIKIKMKIKIRKKININITINIRINIRINLRIKLKEFQLWDLMKIVKWFSRVDLRLILIKTKYHQHGQIMIIGCGLKTLEI